MHQNTAPQDHTHYTFILTFFLCITMYLPESPRGRLRVRYTKKLVPQSTIVFTSAADNFTKCGSAYLRLIDGENY